MSALGFALVLTAAICHATWNFLIKRIQGGVELVWLFSTISVVVYLPLAAVVYASSAALNLAQLGFIIGSALLHFVYLLVLQLGYRHGELSLIYPTARATGPILATSFAVLLLGENITPQIALGGGIIIFAIVMLTMGGRGGRVASSNALVSLGFGLGVGLLIGSYTTWDAYAVSTLATPPVLLGYAALLMRVVLLAPQAVSRRHAIPALWRTHKYRILGIAVFNPLAYLLVLIALSFTPVVFVAPIRESSVLFSVLFGSLLLGEGHLRQRLLWALVIVLGVTLLALSA